MFISENVHFFYLPPLWYQHLLPLLSSLSLSLSFLWSLVCVRHKQIGWRCEWRILLHMCVSPDLCSWKHDSTLLKVYVIFNCVCVRAHTHVGVGAQAGLKRSGESLKLCRLVWPSDTGARHRRQVLWKSSRQVWRHFVSVFIWWSRDPTEGLTCYTRALPLCYTCVLKYSLRPLTCII